MAGHLIHFFWREVIQADHCVLEVVSQGYSIESLQTPQFRVSQFQRVRNTPPPPAGPDILSKEEQGLLRSSNTNFSRPGEE